jgi:uncharacterized protein
MPPDPTPPSVAVQHNPDARRYEAVVDGQLAWTEYEPAGDRLVFTHTFVPPGLRRRGLAATLARTALLDARASGRRVVPRCSYVARFIAEHPEFGDLVR